MVDDLGWQDVGCYCRDFHKDEPFYETPHMDRLASRGMRFIQAYSPAMTCAPSRAAYLTGQYTPHNGVYHVNMGCQVPRLQRRTGLTLLSVSRRVGPVTIFVPPTVFDEEHRVLDLPMMTHARQQGVSAHVIRIGAGGEVARFTEAHGTVFGDHIAIDAQQDLAASVIGRIKSSHLGAKLAAGLKFGIDNPWNRYELQGSTASAVDFFRFPLPGEPGGGMAGFEVSASAAVGFSSAFAGVAASFLA